MMQETKFKPFPASLPATSQIISDHTYCLTHPVISLSIQSYPCSQGPGLPNPQVSPPSKAVSSFILSGTRLLVLSVKPPLITEIYPDCCSFDQLFISFISSSFIPSSFISLSFIPSAFTPPDCFKTFPSIPLFSTFLAVFTFSSSSSPQLPQRK